MRIPHLIRSACLLTALPLQIAFADPPTVDHAAFDKILKENVHGDRVDYLNIRANHWREFYDYFDHIRSIDPRSLERDERLALYINLYNASIIRTVMEEYFEGYHFHTDYRMVPRAREIEPAESERRMYTQPRFYPGFITQDSMSTFPEFRTLITLGEFIEPRAHAALCDANRTSPRLRNHAYTGDKIHDQLNDAMRDFLNDPKRNRIDTHIGQARLNPLFKKHKRQFGSDEDFRYFISHFSGINVSVHNITYLKADDRLNFIPPRDGEWITATRQVEYFQKPGGTASIWEIPRFTVLFVLGRDGNLIQVYNPRSNDAVWITAEHTRPTKWTP